MLAVNYLLAVGVASVSAERILVKNSAALGGVTPKIKGLSPVQYRTQSLAASLARLTLRCHFAEHSRFYLRICLADIHFDTTGFRRFTSRNA